MMALTAVMRTRPLTARLPASARRTTPATSSSMRVLRASTRAPTGVGCQRPSLRSNKGVPRLSSRARRRRATVVWSTFRLRAAAASVPSRPITTRKRRSSQFIVFIPVEACIFAGK